MENHNIRIINENNNKNEDLASIVDGRNLAISGINMSGVPNHKSPLDDLLQDTTHPNNFLQLHNQMFAPLTDNEEKNNCNDDDSTQVVAKHKSKKRARKERRDNSEAVRRYYQKLKVREAELEDEVKKLRVLNQELMKRLEGEAAMQDEVTLLKCLLVDIRGRIEGEICSFRHNKPTNNNKNACFNGCNCGGVDRVSNGDQIEDLSYTSNLGQYSNFGRQI